MAVAASEVTMVRIRAKVRSEADAPRQTAVSLNDERTSSEKTAHFPIPDSIEIEGGHRGGYLLIHVYLREGPFIHTWHSTLQEAKDEAKQDFSIQDDEWELMAEEES
ncbi:MAG: hypothetical protein ACLQPD_15265 [Desulfomonilaceae bacterium]